MATSELAPMDGHRTHAVGDVSSEIHLEPVQHDPHRKKFQYACYGLIIAGVIIIGLLITTIYYATAVDKQSGSSPDFSSGFSSNSSSESSADDSLLEPLCDTGACLNLASDILRSLNTSADPCEDFAEYVCGGWEAENNWELSKLDWYSNFLEMQQEIKEIFLNAIVTEKQLLKEPSVAAAKLFYESCYSSVVTEEDLQSEELLQEFIKMVNFSDYNPKHLKSNSSAISDAEWDAETARAFQEAMAWTHNKEWFDLFHLFIEDDGIVAIEQNPIFWLTYNRSDWETQMTETYIPLYESLFSLTEEQSLFIAALVLDFMDEVAAITTADDSYLDFTVYLTFIRNMTISELNNLFGGQVGLMDYEQLLVDVFKCADTSCVDSVVYLEPGIEYFRNLASLINETSPYIVQYWLFTDILESYFNYGHQSESFAQSREDDRRDYCYNIIEENFGQVVGYILSLKTYPTQKSELASNITERVLKDGVTALMPEVDWLDDHSLNNSLKKADNMDFYVGIPPNFSNIDLINEVYNEITMNLNLSNGFIQNYDSILEFNKDNALKSFRGDSIKLHGSWPSLFSIPQFYPFWLTGVNAFYAAANFGGEKGNWLCMYVYVLNNYGSFPCTYGSQSTASFNPTIDIL